LPHRPQTGTAVGATWQDIVVLAVAAKEGYDELTPEQYLHVQDQVKQLVGFGRRDFESILSIAPFGDFWELKEKGGTLGKKNLRVYFAFDPKANEVVVLHTYKKEDDGKAPPHIMIRLRNRLRMYLKGDFADNVIRYRRPE
jgi:hypothetical protein